MDQHGQDKKQSMLSTTSVTDFRERLQSFRDSISVPIKNVRTEANNEKRWRLSYLKGQFESLQLHTLFRRYTERISHGFFSQFLSLQLILNTIHFILVLIPNIDNPVQVLPDLILYAITATAAFIILLIVDYYSRNNNKTALTYFSIALFLLIYFVNLFIPLYHTYEHQDRLFRPAYTTHLIIASYVFLNVRNNIVAIVLGIFLSVSHVVTLTMTAYTDSPMLWQRILTDAIFLICINGLGIYFRYMNEIVKRRSFLDRRACLESTFQLKFEKEQEDQLMSSILPKHIIEEVRTDIMNYWDYIEKSNKMPRKKPFDNPYVRVHENVSILFADIVNYTEMTSALNINDLLDTLNDLFGRFDDASEELKVLRIKFLGDCYYCVAGLPPDPAPNHAEACVDLGLRMISIIADVRLQRNLNINMRIGIHSGKIVSGIIGSIKWQYDIWSNDVDIANKMETEGCAGKVHITNKTKSLLKKDYDIISTDKGETVPQFKQNHIETFLISPQMLEPASPDVVAAASEPNKPSTVINEVVNGSTENQRRNTVYRKRNTASLNDPRLSNNKTANGNGSATILEQRADDADDNANEPNNQRRDTIYSKKASIISGNDRRLSGNPALASLHKRLTANSSRRLTAGNGKRRTAFMNNNIKRYEERLNDTNRELGNTIENMFLSKYEQWFKESDVNPCLLSFKNCDSELNFFQMPDPLFKYYLLIEIVLIVVVFIMENLTLPQWNWTSWYFYVTIGTIVFVFLPLTWTHYLWSRHISKYEVDSPENRIVRFFYDKSKFVTNNAIARLLIYTVVCVLFSVCVVSELIECKNVNDGIGSGLAASNGHNFLFLMLRVPSPSSSNATENVECIIPWHMTETCALAIVISFVFLRMYIWIKLLYALIMTALYVYCVWTFSDGFYKGSETFNYFVKPQMSHTISVVFLAITLHLIDRQTEYINRLDHLWYETLIKEQGKATSVHFVNNMLLQNILPIRVAELYLSVDRQQRSSTDLFHEQYDSAAVMFASIVNYATEYKLETTFLKVMNRIICDFDMLSEGNAFGRPIEKIKIAKWTYMAACGLVPGLGNAENIRRDQNNHSVISLIKFASCLMKTLQRFNLESKQEFEGCQLRIGISYGLILGGVVGSKKPLYDIWGDPVNMASRMDTTGIPNQIQVLKETAEIVQAFGYVCRYRGEIFVKGRDRLVPTYFVALDENFDLIKLDEQTSD